MMFRDPFPSFALCSLGFSSFGYTLVFTHMLLHTRRLVYKMRKILRDKIIRICDIKIKSKGPEVGVSFYAFFSNKNDDPEILMEAATWWIQTMKLDHFEKATKIKKMVESLR